MPLPTNVIEIKAPRWRDRTILVAPWKVGFKNQIIISARRSDGSRYYPEPLEVEGAVIGRSPKTTIKTRTGGTVEMYVVKLDDLLEDKTWVKEPVKVGTTPISKTPSSPKASANRLKGQLPGQMQLPGTEHL